jgi:hypothetical protein
MTRHTTRRRPRKLERRKVSRALDSVTDTRPLDSRRREPRKRGRSADRRVSRSWSPKKKKRVKKKTKARLQIRHSGTVRSGCVGVGRRWTGAESRAADHVRPRRTERRRASRRAAPLGGWTDGEKFSEPGVTPRPQGCFAGGPSAVSRPRCERNRTRRATVRPISHAARTRRLVHRFPSPPPRSSLTRSAETAEAAMAKRRGYGTTRIRLHETGAGMGTRHRFRSASAETHISAHGEAGARDDVP